MRPSIVKLFVSVLLAASAFAVGGISAAPARAATPCWRTLINDWFDGRINHTYPQWCYQQALGHLPRDVQYYSDAKDAITAAMREAAREHKKPDYNASTGKFNGGGGAGPTSGNGGGGPDSGSSGVIGKVIGWLGPSNAEQVPLPLLILAAVALLLLAAAGGSVLSKRLQARRVPPPNR